MAFQVKVNSPALREEIIKKATDSSSETERFFDFRTRETQLKIILIPEQYLVYRMENFRTFTDQHTYLAREHKTESFFSGGQENTSVQQVQHEILAALARKGEGDSVVPVIDVLRKDGQRDPLLITHRGVVVNGNRRLSAMRELLAEDESANASFKYTRCMVLPSDTTAAEILDIEALLQGRPETKLDYDWIGDAQLIKRLTEVGRSEKEVALKLNRKITEIKNSLAALTEAELYLRDWTKTPGEYTKVKDSEQFFKDIPDLIKGKETDLAEASRVIGWTLHDNKEKLSERLYAFNRAIGPGASDVLDRLSTELGIETDVGDEADDDDFSVDIDEPASGVSYRSVIDTLRNPASRDEAVERLVEISRSVVEEARGKKFANAALKAIGIANARLTEVDLDRADPNNYPAIGRQLEQIAKRTGELQAKLQKLMAADATSRPSSTST